MSIGKQLPYERSGRKHDATGSLLFDQERKHGPAPAEAVTARTKAASAKKARH